MGRGAILHIHSLLMFLTMCAVVLGMKNIFITDQVLLLEQKVFNFAFLVITNGFQTCPLALLRELLESLELVYSGEPFLRYCTTE